MHTLTTGCSCRAKWEERDTRWIVEERKDGANVNAWHWQETSRLAWSRQRLAELLTGLVAELDPCKGHACITGVKDLTGEVCCQLLVWIFWILGKLHASFYVCLPA